MPAAVRRGPVRAARLSPSRDAKPADGSLGWREQAPFDRILVAGSGCLGDVIEAVELVLEAGDQVVDVGCEVLITRRDAEPLQLVDAVLVQRRGLGRVGAHLVERRRRVEVADTAIDGATHTGELVAEAFGATARSVASARGQSNRDGDPCGDNHPLVHSVTSYPFVIHPGTSGSAYRDGIGTARLKLASLFSRAADGTRRSRCPAR